jgi:hypothetical protein
MLGNDLPVVLFFTAIKAPGRVGGDLLHAKTFPEIALD